jgi:hypothetical protein
MFHAVLAPERQVALAYDDRGQPVRGDPVQLDAGPEPDHGVQELRHRQGTHHDAAGDAVPAVAVGHISHVCRAADVFTFDNATALIESLRIDFGELDPFGIRP